VGKRKRTEVEGDGEGQSALDGEGGLGLLGADLLRAGLGGLDCWV